VPRRAKIREEVRRPDAPGVGPRDGAPDVGAHYPSLEDIEAVVTRYAGREKEREVGEVIREIREIKSRGETRERSSARWSCRCGSSGSSPLHRGDRGA